MTAKSQVRLYKFSKSDKIALITEKKIAIFAYYLVSTPVATYTFSK